MKILFTIDALREGGITTSLINLLNNLDFDNDDIYLFSFHEINLSSNLIPKKVKIIKSNYLLDLVSSSSYEIKNNFVKFILRKFLAMLCYLFDSDIIYNFIFKFYNLNEEFDIAISYTNNVGDHSLYFGCNKFVIEKVNAKKKFAWLHVNYEKMRLNTKINNIEYTKFNKIIIVSNYSKQIFLKYNPNLSDKCSVVYNLCDIQALNLKANFPVQEDFDNKFLNLITISRLDENKDPYKIISISKKLKSNGIKFIWRILGNGPLYNEMIKLTKDNNLESNVKFYGYRDNPYPFLKKSDIYVSTSKSEGFGLSILEALYFRIPVLCGYYDSINEILDENSGWIIKNDVDCFVNKIIELYLNYDLILEKKHTIHLLFSNEDNLIKIRRIFYD